MQAQPVILGLKTRLILVAVIFFCGGHYQSTMAMPPTQEVIQQLKESGQLEKMIAQRLDAEARGLNSSTGTFWGEEGKFAAPTDFSAAEVDTFRALLILVDFSDNVASGGYIFGQPVDFDNLIFSIDSSDSHYSAAEFYVENSFGTFIMQGDVVGWYRMPQTYAYYVDGQRGFGDYPQNAQGLARDAILAADPDVDYSDYDNDNNGSLDGVFIVHAGTGYESSGNVNEIHSHKWALAGALTLDGISISEYTMEPEEQSSSPNGLSTMGVFAHEYGHFLGLPDLYDTDYSSSGTGDWSLMSGGSWNGGGRFPAFMDAWCKSRVGFINPINVIGNMTEIEFPATNHNPVTYKIWRNGTPGAEYFLISNRQRYGYDYAIPGDGLLILHINENFWGNSNEPDYLVAIEQADGLLQLEAGYNDGDGSDIWSTSTKTEFTDLSNPNTKAHDGSLTKVAVWNISASDSVMTANLDIVYSRPYFQLASFDFSDATMGNGDGVVDAGETITLEFGLTNLWANAYNVTGTLSCDNNDITFGVSQVNIGSITGEGGTGDNSSQLLNFTVPADFSPCVDSFYLEVFSDNGFDTRVFGFELNVGSTDVLVVDDDDGGDYQTVLTSRFLARRTPYDVWDKSTLGVPSAGDLNAYGTVMWIIGDARPDIFSSSDVTALTSFLDNGGNLFLTGQSLVGQLDVLNQAFLNDYFRVEYDSTFGYYRMDGQPGTPIGDGIEIRYDTDNNQTEVQVVSPINGSVADFDLGNGGGTVGVSYQGTYKLVLFSFGIEALTDVFEFKGYSPTDTVFERVIEFFYPSSESINPSFASIDIVGETNTNVLGHVPTFLWSVVDTTANSIIEYEVAVGTGTRCHNSDNIWAPGVVSGDEVSVVFDGVPLEDGNDYYFHLHVNNGESWSEKGVLAFHMNMPPVMGILGVPTGGEQVTTATPELRNSFGTDSDGDDLTYVFEVYSDEALTILVASATEVPHASPVRWTVDVPLIEDQQYFWRVRCFDGFEYSDYTEASMFYVNAVNQAPLAFDLLSPVNGGFAFGQYPRLTWLAAEDPDPNDILTYTLLTSENPTFSSYESTADLVDTFRTVTYPLTIGSTYYWKVLASDLGGANTWSSQTFSFSVALDQCCLGKRGNANGDESDETNISDVTYLVSYLFGIPLGPQPVCLEEGNVNGDTDGSVNISDITYLVDYLFGIPSGPLPPDCP